MEAAARAASANAKFRPVMIDTDVVTRFCVTTRPPSTEPVRTLPDVGHAQPVVFLPGPNSRYPFAQKVAPKSRVTATNRLPCIRMPSLWCVDGPDQLLAEQIAYYRAHAPDYSKTVIPWTAAQDELVAAVQGFRPTGHVLELACGPGTWTPGLLRGVASLTAVDASPEMLELAAKRVEAGAVRFIRADLFNWQPDRRYDAIFFGFWLSHIPHERFAPFWSMIDTALHPRGQVFFIDDNLRAPDELIEGEASSTIQRRLSDGTPHRIVKVPHDPKELEERLNKLGWRITVTPTSGPYYWGAGQRA
jgi:trans-aconitate methyltransferase